VQAIYHAFIISVLDKTSHFPHFSSGSCWMGGWLVEPHRQSACRVHVWN